MKNTELLKTNEVANRLNISRDKVLQLIEDGTLRAIRLGPKTIRVFAESVSRVLEGKSNERV